MDQTTRIDSLRVKGVPMEASHPKLALSSLLGRADLHPLRTAPTAILIVRRLADPLPGQVALQRGAPRLATDWERAVQQALADLHRRAARPGRGHVPASSEAVLFADEAEMLACLALDVLRGQARHRWWWRVVLRQLALTGAVTVERVLGSQLRALPAALDYLAGWDRAAAVAGSLTPGAARGLLEAMMRAHRLPVLDLAGGRSEPLDEHDRPGRQFLPSQPSADGDSGRLPAGEWIAWEADPPWKHRLPPSIIPRTLPRETACLLGVGLDLHRHPVLVRRPEYREAVRRWWLGRQQAPSREPARGNADAPPSRSEETYDFLSPGSPAAPGERSRPPPTSTAEPALALLSGEDTASASSGQTLGDGSPGKQARVNQRTHPPTGSTQAQGNQGAGHDTPAIAFHSDPESKPIDAAEPASGLESRANLDGGVFTRLAGVLYLVNLMRQLDLPDCFEDAWRLASQVGPWGILELLARALLGPETDYLLDDPLWAGLAHLDGRDPGTLPGGALRGSEPAAYQLPRTWLPKPNQPADREIHWLAGGGRLLAWSEAGYLLLDLPEAEISLEAERRIRQALRGYLARPVLVRDTLTRAPLDALNTPYLEGLNPTLAWWLSRAMPYVRSYLVAALRVVPGDLPSRLLLYPGRLYVSATHIDVVMALNDISVPVRAAGLDLDPGWLPDMARIVAFHFE